MPTLSNHDDVENIVFIDTLVHLGAGRCSELDGYLALKPRQLWLIEADPQLAEELKSRTEGLNQVHVRCEAIAGQSGPATLHRYNLPELNSLRTAIGLLDLFPGLKTLGRLQVEATSPLKLLQQLELRAEQQNRLVIDLPGEERPVLQALQQSQQLYLFDHVQLHCGRKPLYEGSEPAALLLKWLREKGFDLVAEDNSRDPDRPTLTFQRNALKLRNRNLQKQLEALKDQLEQSTRNHEELANQAEEIQEQVQRLTKECDAQAKLAAERQQQIAQLTQTRDQQVKLARELQAQVEQLTKTRNNQAKLSGYRQLQIQQLTNAQDEQKKLSESQKAEINNFGSPEPESQHTLGALKSLVNKTQTRRLAASSTFLVKPLAQIDLGDAWAGTTINTVIFRHHAVLSLGEYQYTAFYADAHTLRLIKRHLIDNTLQNHDITAEYSLSDAHNTISLGIDRASFLHVSYDHHGTHLRYRRSNAPHSIHGWTGELPMTGAHEEKVTYPCFILPPQGPSVSNAPLMLLYRDGIWNRGSTRIKTYDEAAQCWTDRPTPILSGSDQKPWTSNAYWNHPATGDDGSLHLSFVWRTDSIGEEARINNINVCYARSLDNGMTWHTSHNRPYKLPITQVNAETVYPVSPGCNLINQCSMALDSLNRPHIVFYSDDPDGIPQYQHLWFDGKAWHHKFISQRTSAFGLMGNGTLQIPISRPEIVIDRKDNAYVIYRGDITGNRMAITHLPAPNYEFTPEHTCIVWDEDLGYSEPVIDRIRWRKENILTMLLQHNHQPDGDRTEDLFNAPVTLIDLRLK